MWTFVYPPVCHPLSEASPTPWPARNHQNPGVEGKTMYHYKYKGPIAFSFNSAHAIHKHKQEVNNYNF